MNAPLAGLLVADLTQNVAGPYCTQILGDMGAEIVKVERPGRGDDARAWAPPYWGRESASFMSVNRNKRSLAVDMKGPEGRGILERLIGRADILVQSLRAGLHRGAGARLGAGAPDQSAPRVLLHHRVRDGGAVPRSPGLRSADAGLQRHHVGHRSSGSTARARARLPRRHGDGHVGGDGYHGRAHGARAHGPRRARHDGALRHRGRVDHVSDVELFGSGERPEPQGSGTPMIAPYEAFPSRDGWLMIAAGSDALFGKCCSALGVPALASDARFSTNPARVANRPALVEAMSAATRALTTDDLLARLQNAGVPTAPIQTLDQVAAHPQTEASGMLIPAKHPRVSDYRAVGLPIRWDGERPGVSRVPPLLGEHTAEILAELGYDNPTIKELAARHVIQL